MDIWNLKFTSLAFFKVAELSFEKRNLNFETSRILFCADCGDGFADTKFLIPLTVLQNFCKRCIFSDIQALLLFGLNNKEFRRIQFTYTHNFLNENWEASVCKLSTLLKSKRNKLKTKKDFHDFKELLRLVYSYKFQLKRLNQNSYLGFPISEN